VRRARVGIATWLYSFVVTFALRGGFAVVLGLMFFSVGVVFMAILASLFKAMWEPFFTVLVLAVVTCGSRMLGYAIGNSQPVSRDVDLAI
jgi:ABC-type transport system involved in multi-copper enzyme maturation permease subunit